MAEGREAAEEIGAEQRQRPGFAKGFLGEAPTTHAVLIRIAGEECIRLFPDVGGK